MKKLPFAYEKEFDQTIDDLLVSKRIQPSTSAWAAQVVLVKKPDGTLRTTIDYKHLKPYIERDAYPMRFPQDIFARLGKAKYYTVIDLTSAYWQIPLHPDSRKYTAFQCKRGLFEFLVMPMGITDASKTLQRGVDITLGDNAKGLDTLIGKICDAYHDDLIGYSEGE